MEIIKESNKILGEKLNAIESLPSNITEIVSDMKKTMYTNKGVGLAANQVGLDMQLFVIDENLAKENGVTSVYINPKITNFSKDQDEMEEGCLSIPEYYIIIPRSKKIIIRSQDENGKKVKFKARGFLARVLQHEYDHLQGILIKNKK